MPSAVGQQRAGLRGEDHILAPEVEGSVGIDPAGLVGHQIQGAVRLQQARFGIDRAVLQDVVGAAVQGVKALPQLRRRQGFGDPGVPVQIALVGHGGLQDIIIGRMLRSHVQEHRILQAVNGPGIGHTAQGPVEDRHGRVPPQGRVGQHVGAGLQPAQVLRRVPVGLIPGRVLGPLGQLHRQHPADHRQKFGHGGRPVGAEGPVGIALEGAGQGGYGVMIPAACRNVRKRSLSRHEKL